MAIAIGTDIVEIGRIEQVLARQGEAFLARVLTPAEIQQYRDRNSRPDFVAKRFAAKEAVAKALGTGIGRGVSFQDIEISNNNDGAPLVTLGGGALEVLQRLGGNEVLLSIADEQHYALGYALIV